MLPMRTLGAHAVLRGFVNPTSQKRDVGHPHLLLFGPGPPARDPRSENPDLGHLARR